MFEPSPGMRVVVRYADAGTITDALGNVVHVDPDFVVIATAHGDKRIWRNTIEMGHEIPPAPTRPGRVHRVVAPTDLRKVSAATWLPEHTTWLHRDNLAAEMNGAEPTLNSGWLLRAAPGLTGAAHTLATTNTIVPLAPTGMPEAESLDIALSWFTDRSISPHVVLFADLQGQLDPACKPMSEFLRDSGFVPSSSLETYTGATAELAHGLSVPAGLEIVHSEAPAPVHFTAWGHSADGTDSYESFAHLMRGTQGTRFVSAVATHPDGSRSLVGVVRLAVAMKWAVISHLVVAPHAQRKGVGKSLVQVCADMVTHLGVRSVMVEVPTHNTAGVSLVESLGFEHHHRVWFASQQS